MTKQKKLIWLFVAGAAIVASNFSCIVPPPPGRVIVPPRAGFYYYGRHGRVRYFASARPGVTVVVPPVGAFVGTLPDGYTTVVVGGVPYYYCNGVYLRPHRTGYIVVTAPVENPPGESPAATALPAAAPSAADQLQSAPPANGEAKSLSAAPSADTVNVSVPTSKGGFTAVKLVKHDGGYIGPQGEFYTGHPTVDQLKALYGN
jgi:hypothetical protein